MTPLDRDYVKALELMVEHGLAEAQEAIDWACNVVVESANPPEEVLEIAGAIRPHPLDVVNMLRQFPGSADSTRTFRKVLTRIQALLRSRPGALPVVTMALERMALGGEVPEEFAGYCYGLDDTRYLAEEGVYGNIEKLRSELLMFIEAEAERSDG